MISLVATFLKKYKNDAYVFGILAEWSVIIRLFFLGYKLLFHRYKSKYGEIDLIMKYRNSIVFIEIKGRKNALDFERSVSVAQQKRIKRSAQYFMIKHKATNMQMRFDIVIVTSIWKKNHHFINVWQED